MSEIRSVSVHLDADVAGYIAKIKLAGKATDEAFGRTTGIEKTNTSLQTTESRLGGVDRAGQKAEGTLRRLDGTMSRAGSNGNGFSRATAKLDGFVGKLGLIPSLAIPATAALVPLAAAGAGVAAAFAAPLVFTGGAVTLFALLGGAAIKQTQKQYKNIDTLAKSVQTARLSLEQSTRSAGKNASTSTSVANAQERLNKATLAYHDALKGLSPQQRQFHDALENLDSDFGKFIRGPVGKDLLAPFTQGLKVADDLLPHAAPIIHVVSDDLGQLLSEFDKYAQSPGFDKFVHDISRQVGPDLLDFGHMLGSISHGVGGLLQTLGKRLSPGLMHDLTHMTDEFSHWANSKQGRHDVQEFIDYVHRVGPDAAGAIESLARGGAHLVHALAPLGPPTLHVIKGIADAVSGIPTGTLTQLAKTSAELVVFGKLGGFKLLGKLDVPGVGGKGGGLAGGLFGGGVQKVYVVNFPPELGGPGGPGGEPLPVDPRGAGRGALGTAEAEASRAAKAAADAVRAAGGSAAAESQAAARAFKEAMAAHDVAVIRGALGFAGGGGIRGLLRGLLSPVAGFALGGWGTEVNPQHKQPITGSALVQDLQHQYRSGAMSLPQIYSFFGGKGGFSKAAIDEFLQLTNSSKLDRLHAGLARASRDMDLVGHSADRGFGGANRGVSTFTGKLDHIKSGPAAAALDLVGHSAQRNFSQAGADADRFQHHIDGLHGPKPINIHADTSQAEAAVRRLYADLALIRSKTITVTTQHTTGGSVKAGADGMTVPGPRYPYGDKIHAFLAPGEEVISNRYGQADQFRADRASGRIPGYAGGGTVGGGASTSGGIATSQAHGVSTELHRLRGSLAATRHEFDLERQQRQQLRQARAQLVSTVRDSFRSQIFGVTPSGGIWGAGASSDPLAILRQDIRGARTYRTDIGRLRRRGLRGGALAQVQTLAEAQQATGLSRAEDREISRLYAVRQRASLAAGATLGDARYGAQLASIDGRIAETNHRLHAVESAVKHHEAEQKKNTKATAAGVSNAVNGAARTARRRGRPSS